MCTVYCVLHRYSDRGGMGESGNYCVLHGYSDRGGGRGERVAVGVQYTYCHSYCVLHGYSDRRWVGEREWQYVYSLLCLTQIL